MRVLPLLLLLMMSPAYSLEVGYVKVWEKKLSNTVAAVQPFAYDADGEVNDIVVACYNNRVYFYNERGEIKGTYIGRSSFTALATYQLPTYTQVRRVAAGSLDDFVYSLWRAYGMLSIYNDPENPKLPHNVHWYFDTGDDVYYITSVDIDEDGVKESLAVGTGSYYSTSPGKLILLNSTGSKIWEKSFSREVKYITSFDPDGDSFSSHIAAAYGNTVVVLDKDGRHIWARTFKEEVKSIAPADFLRKGELTDILVSEGRKIHAINPRNLQLWEMELDNPVVSLRSVDRNWDGIIDYYLVSSGPYIIAIENSPSAPRVLWRYYAGGPVGRIVNFALEPGKAKEDIVVFKNNTLAVYIKTFIKKPRVKLSLKKLAEREFQVVIDNLGDGSALSVKASFAVIKENTTIRRFNLDLGDIKKYSSSEVNLTLGGPGNYSVEVVVSYSDEYGVGYKSVEMFPLMVQQEEAEGREEENSAEKVTEPKPDVIMNISAPDVVKEGNVFLVEVTLENRGDAPARNISLNFEPSENIIFMNSTWSGNLGAGDKKKIVFTFKVKRRLFMLRSKNETLPPASLVYTDETDKAHSLQSEPLYIKIKPNKLKYLLILLPVVALIAYVVASQRSKKVDVEEEVVKIYMKYKKSGKVPPYSAFKKLGLDKKTLKELIIKLKKEGKIQ